MSKAVLTPKDLYAIKDITDVQLSPDGRKVVYCVQQMDLEDDKPRSSLWLVWLEEGSQPVRLTAHRTDKAPRWAPDSERIAFTSERDEKSQIHIISISGGEAEIVKTEKSPDSALLWSPDGKYIACRALVDVEVTGPRYPGEPEELLPKKEEENKDKKDKKDAKKDKVHVISDMDYKADAKGMIYDKYAQVFVVAVDGTECRQLTERQERVGEFVWNRSGTALLYLVDKPKPDSVHRSTLIRQVDVDNKAEALLMEFDGRLVRIDLSPDGHWLLLAGVDNSFPIGTGEAMLWTAGLKDQPLPLGPDSLICLTADVGASCVEPRWVGDSVYFIRQWRGANEFGRVEVRDGHAKTFEVLPLTDLAMIARFEMADQDNIVFVAHSFVKPPELFLRQGDSVRQLTELNREFAEKYEMLPAEKYTYRSADDWEVEGWLVKPLNYEEGRLYPTILSIHGGPTGAYYDAFQFPFQLMAHQGFAVVFTNPRGSVTYGTKFAQGVVQDWGGKDYEDIMNGLDKAIEIGVVDPSRVGVMGWSYGGYMTSWAITQTNRFKAAIAGAIVSNIYTLAGCSDSHSYAESLWERSFFDREEDYMQRSAIRHVRNVTTPLLIQHGEADIRCPIDQSEQFYIALKRLGKEVV
ncbi:MAG TPA: S9 family peptidase, partial [Bacillota bacterium]|nr:S9 family peptidase [Bacillota bacterium]